MGTTVTVATLYDDDQASYHVAVIHGRVSEDDRHALAASFNARYLKDADEEEDERYVYFAETEACDSAKDVESFGSIYGRE